MVILSYPIGHHRIHGAGIYANIGGILMGSMLPNMLPYIAAPWILWVCYHLCTIPEMIPISLDQPDLGWLTARRGKERKDKASTTRRDGFVWFDGNASALQTCRSCSIQMYTVFIFSDWSLHLFFSPIFMSDLYVFQFPSPVEMKIEVDLARIKLAQTCFVCISDVPKRFVWSFRGSGPAPSENRDDKAWPLPLLEIDLNPRPVKGGDVVGASGAASCARASNDCEWCTCDGWAEIFYDFSWFFDVLWCLLTCHCHQETPVLQQITAS